MEITLSSFTEVLATKPVVSTFTSLRQLSEELKSEAQTISSVAKSRFYLLSAPAVWSEPHRLARNVKELGNVFIADIDAISEGKMLSIMESLEGTRLIYYTSFNHNIAKHTNDNPEELCRFRLIIELDRRYPKEAHPAVWSAANSRLQKCIDLQTKDPARMFTAPVTQEGQPPVEIEIWDGKPWVVDELLLEAVYTKDTGKHAESPELVPADALELREVFGEWARQRKSQHRKKMGKVGLLGLDGEPMAAEGARDDTVFRLACQIVDRWPNINPVSVAELFSASLESMGIDDPDFMANKMAAHQQKRLDEVKRVQKESMDARSALINLSFGGTRRHPCTEEERRALLKQFDLEEAPEILKRLYIVSLKRFSYLLRPDGTYMEPIANTDLSPAAERDLAVFEDYHPSVVNSHGERRLLTHEILSECEVLSSVRYDLSATRTSYDRSTRTMTVAPCPPKWKPREHPEVQRWLDVLDGKHGLATDMASTMGRLDQIAPALVLTGGAGTGKTFWATIAASIYSHGGGWTDINDFTDSFNDTVRECPIIVADEKPGAEYAKSGSAFVRSHLSRTVRSYNEKYMPKGKLYGAVRMIFLANDIEALATKEDLGAEDMKAFLERFVHIPMPSASKEYLLGLGGSKYLNESWLVGGAAPEHFLWLARNHKIRNPGDRFLVKGPTDQLHRKVFGRQGIKGEVITFLLNYLAEGTARAIAGGQKNGIRVEKGGLYVQARTIHSLWSAMMGKDRAPTQNAIAKALKGGIAVASTASKKLPMPSGPRGNYYEIDLEVLQGALDSHHITRDAFKAALS